MAAFCKTWFNMPANLRTKHNKALTLYIAQCMRQKNVVWNKDQDASLKRVKEDIAILSNNHLNCDFPEFDNLPARVMVQPMQMKRKKNK